MLQGSELLLLIFTNCIVDRISDKKRMLTNMTSMICYQNNIVLHQFFNLLLMDVNTKTCSAISIIHSISGSDVCQLTNSMIKESKLFVIVWIANILLD
jgi:hypothetical protein